MEDEKDFKKSFEKVRDTKSSMKVNKSISALKSEGLDLDETDRTMKRPSPLNFEAYLPWACKLFQLDVVVQSSKVDRFQAQQSRSSKLKKRKKSETAVVDEDVVATTTPSAKTSSTFMGKGFYGSYKPFEIIATYDNIHNLTKINMNNNREIPRTLLIILSLIIKFYPALNTLTVNSGLNIYSIYEISKFLPTSAIKEIFLDGTCLKTPCYHILLETTNRLTCLSLSRCQIDDEVFKCIADLLAFPLPASKTLTFLNVSSNRITDQGVSYLAKALRTNRTLACLNLSDNQINDTGASYIFDTLLPFYIDVEEMIESKYKRLEYNKNKMLLVTQFIAELKIAEEMKTVKKKTLGTGIKGGKTHGLEIKESLRDCKSVGTDTGNKIYNIKDRKYEEKAYILATKTLGEYIDPFQSPRAFTENGKSFCVGNTALASLNLSYNNLSYLTLKKLIAVLNYQKGITDKQRGLFRVRIEGNNIPVMCEEYTEMDELLYTSLELQTQQPLAKKKFALK